MVNRRGNPTALPRRAGWRLMGSLTCCCGLCHPEGLGRDQTGNQTQGWSDLCTLTSASPEMQVLDGEVASLL